METAWISDDEHFRILTELIRETVNAGVMLASELPDQKQDLLDQATEDGIAKRDELFDCPHCDATYSSQYYGELCDCGESLPESSEIEPHTIQYYENVYPEFFKQRLGENLDEFSIVYRDDRIENIPANDLHSAGKPGKYIHISPFFDSGTDIYPFPGFNDLFISWPKVRELILDTDEVIEDLRDFIDEPDEYEKLIGDGGKVYGGIEQPNTSDLRLGWYDLQTRTSKDVADRRSQEEFEINYNKLFEKLGVEFLGLMLPHALTIEGGKHGQPEPDGYLHVLHEEAKRTYLIESKCYSRDFKIFDESDKGTRYIRDFIRDIEPETDYNLVGHIFIANRYNDDRTHEDIDDYVSQNIESRNLDVICLNDEMMSSAAERLRRLYREEPSASHRIYRHSSWYSGILDGMQKVTQEYGVDKDAFKENVMELVSEAGEEETNREKTLEQGFDRKQGYEAFKQRVSS